ncbi:DUF1501 domain-containing protein [Marinigracilibium pacificum]|uniref:DUF1501 domain-containing protein n=1 Tax=Marinigracilibium pacificum TaxID=2729599 RepID=A0A848J0J7_9BACT|nr:DUF1501 domain-containing protein [Marinigracilibium pacificum]NMM47799.1 DUF1501 domain-containing protein [Marinigracilibium pacificum]
MKRRNFLKLVATSSSGLLLVPDFLYSSPIIRSTESINDNILVFIQLNGGNDGLNTIIPFDDPLYYHNRPTIGIEKSKVISHINGTGFHPALKDVATIAQAGDLSVIQNVGYPNPNRSHFRSIEIWQTGSESNQYLDRGWLGRFLDVQCNDEHLASLNIDSTDNLALKSSSITGVTIKDLNRLRQFNNADNDLKLSDNPQLDFVRKISFASQDGMEEIRKAIFRSQNFNETYSPNELSKKLQWISQLIKGDLGSKVYYTSLNGFDTHNNQLFIQDKNLTILNDAIFSFYRDLKANNLLNRVTIVVFSEFGRRVKENGSGTDHGTAGPMLVIGGKNKGQVIGNNPDLINLDNGDLIFENDFRSVYASLLKSKFDFDSKDININQPILPGLF